MTVADNIKKGRKAARLSQVKLAALLGVTRSAINQWEKNTPKLRREHIIGLAKHLNQPESPFTVMGGDVAVVDAATVLPITYKAKIDRYESALRLIVSLPTEHDNALSRSMRTIAAAALG